MMYIIVTGRCLATAADAARSCDFRSVLYEARGSFTWATEDIWRPWVDLQVRRPSWACIWCHRHPASRCPWRHWLGGPRESPPSACCRRRTWSETRDGWLAASSVTGTRLLMLATSRQSSEWQLHHHTRHQDNAIRQHVYTQKLYQLHGANKNKNKYVRLRGRPYIHTCRFYVHTPRDVLEMCLNFTNGASLAWSLRRRISTVTFTCGWAWPARWPIRPIWGFWRSKVHKNVWFPALDADEPLSKIWRR